MNKTELMQKSSELSFLMEKLVALHRNLVDVLDEENRHMVALDTKGLFETAQTKEVLIAEIWNVEQLRLRVTEMLTLLAGLPAGTAVPVTLQTLTNHLPKEQASKLAASRTALQLLMERARERNMRNMGFAQQSLGRIEEMKRNIMGLNNNNSENYSNSGVRQPITEQGGRLLSTEA